MSILSKSVFKYENKLQENSIKDNEKIEACISAQKLFDNLLLTLGNFPQKVKEYTLSMESYENTVSASDDCNKFLFTTHGKKFTLTKGNKNVQFIIFPTSRFRPASFIYMGKPLDEGYIPEICAIYNGKIKIDCITTTEDNNPITKFWDFLEKTILSCIENFDN
jgi:hypothetical protein